MSEFSEQEMLLNSLKERAKELNCLYLVQEAMRSFEQEIDEVINKVIEAIPSGWQYPEDTCARIEYAGKIYISENFCESSWVQKCEIVVMDNPSGYISVYYEHEHPDSDEGPFLKEERKLIGTIADLLGANFFHRHLKLIFENNQNKNSYAISEWFVVIDLLKNTDLKLLIRIAKKMVNYMIFKGFNEAERLFNYFNINDRINKLKSSDKNYPSLAKSDKELKEICFRIFEEAPKHLNDREIYSKLSVWIKEDQTNFLISVLGNSGSTLDQIDNVVDRYVHLLNQGLLISPLRIKFIKSSLIRRVLSSQSAFVNVALNFIEVEDFIPIFNHTIYPSNSFGKLGGKSSGLILAEGILKRSLMKSKFTENVKFAETWYLSSDCFFYFMQYNNIEEIAIYKYKEISQVKKEYPYVTTVFKNSVMPPTIERKLKDMLNSLRGKPLIVRSTSLLEDRNNAIFAGKYKSLFISNSGSDQERYEELTNAIAEVYASIYGPDPIEYRRERDLLCYSEEMGIMIQEVVGNKIGKFYFPLFAGVAFTKNNFKWSARLKADDGLIRMVVGLGTRAVDRVSNDYPILVAPKQPALKANTSVFEKIKYSPKYMDVINLETKNFESIAIEDLLEQGGYKVPNIHYLLSEVSENYIVPSRKIGFDFEKKDYVVTFDNLIDNTDFIPQINDIIDVLNQEFGHPIDIEFAHDGKDLYLLQSRMQSVNVSVKQKGVLTINRDNLIFSGYKHVPDGEISNISHIVFVDSAEYKKISDYEDYKEIGNIVGRLNNMLPKRKFIMMGPGRWGSRGDVKLGVHVAYSDINNASMLIEMAYKNKSEEPDFSFGTHFFQDLVESNIFYLPLHVGENQSKFNEEFFVGADNYLAHLLPDAKRFEKVIKVIDVGAESEGKSLNIIMDEEKSEAFAFVDNSVSVENEMPKNLDFIANNDVHWKWRLKKAEHLAQTIPGNKFGIKNIYVFGSTKNATASAGSDIDLIIHFIGDENQRTNMLSWLDGWDRSLAQTNYERTGYQMDSILDVHIVTDEDIANKNSYAIKIGAISDGARLLKMKNNKGN